MPRVRQNREKYRARDFQRAVKSQLAALGLEQKDLAEGLGLTESGMSRVLSKPERITTERMGQIIAYLQLEPEAVLRLYGYPEKAIREVTK